MAHTTAVRVQHAPTPPAHASASASPSRPRRHATDLTRQNRGRIRTGGTPAGTESRVNNEKRCEIRERASWSTPLAPSEEKGPHERTCAGDEQYGFCWVLAASCCLLPTRATWHGAVRPSAQTETGHASRVFCCRSAVVFVDASSYPVDRMAVAAVPTLHCTGPPSSGAIKLLLRVSNNLIVAFSLWIGSSSSSNML
jgi:hypothetical protein